MDIIGAVEKDLLIPKKRCKVISPSRIIALVPQQWAYGEAPRTSGPMLPDDMDERMCTLCLSPSYTHIPEPWIKVSIKYISKRRGLSKCLPLSQSVAISENMGYAELLNTLSSLQSESSWADAHRLYGHHRQIPQPTEESRKSYNDVIRGALTRLYGPSCVRPLSRGQFNQDTADAAPHSLNHNLHPALALLESDDAFYILQHYQDYTLHDLLHFSPCAVYDNSTAKSLFLVYQVLRLMSDLHARGLSIGSLSPHHLLVDQKLWISVSAPCVQSILDLCCVHDVGLRTTSDSRTSPPNHDIDPRDLAPFASLGDVIQLWIERDISNYQYLMCLNYLAGRRIESPNHHPILPWVIDFSSPDSGFRDLTKSKYRINKGDHQLDLTYETDPCIGSLYPHHISDFLSDITYYVYECRRTPKQVLCTHVRRKWVPHEYPTSMQRIYEWSPDECIPAFYTDAGVFKSIHEDLPDLEIPEWCRTPDEFIRRHAELLESDAVSARLHDWIDITFGYKLSGQSAVAAKNVCLQLVNQHTRLTNHGVLQLFRTAHPARSAREDKYWTEHRPHIDLHKHGQDVCAKTEKELETISIHAALQVFGEANVIDPSLLQPHKNRPNLVGVRYNDETISLPDDFNPLAALERLESLYEFTTKSLHEIPTDRNLEVSRGRSRHDRLVNKDMNELACFLVEVMLSSKLRSLSPHASLHERYTTVRTTAPAEWRDLPRAVRRAATILLKLDQDWDPDRGRLLQEQVVPNAEELFVYEDPRLCSGFLLHPAVSYLPFPWYFKQIYSLITELKTLDHRIGVASRTCNSAPELRLSLSEDVLGDLYKDKVLIVTEILIPILPELDSEGVNLILPYIVELFENENTTVSAAWLLFNHIGRALGPRETAAHFLVPLVRLYNGDNASKKHLKLYERSFLTQLFIRLGLQVFLERFSTLLVEAAAAYRDFPGKEEVFEKPIASDQQTAKLSTASIETEYQMRLIDDRRTSRTSTKLDIVMESEPLDTSTTSAANADSENELETMADSILIHSYETSSGYQCLGEDSEEDDPMNHKSDSSCRSRDDDISTCSESSDKLAQSLSRTPGQSVPHRPSELDRPPSTSSTEVEAAEEAGDQESVDDDPPSSTLVRSETEEFTRAFLESYAYKDECNVCDVACESIKWLSRKVGPLLTAKSFSRNLLRMLTLCYVGDEQMEIDPAPPEESCLPAARYRLLGDRNSHRVIQCLTYIATLYGEQVILLQYIPYIKDMISTAQVKFRDRVEAALVGCLALVQDIIPYMTDTVFMDNLQPVLFDEIVLPMIRLASSKRVSFTGGGRRRQAIFHKVIDILYIIGIRIGFEFTRQMMTPVLQRLFASFDRVYGRQTKNSSESQDNHRVAEVVAEPVSDMIEDNVFCEIKKDPASNEYKISTPIAVDQLGTASSWQYSLSPPFSENRDGEDSDTSTALTQESIMAELRNTLTPELAHAAYIPLCKLAGGIYMNEKLTNHDLIIQLCSEHDQALSQRQVSPDTDRFSDDDTAEFADGTPPFPQNRRKSSDSLRKPKPGTPSGRPSKQNDSEDAREDLEVSGQFGRNVSMSGNRIIVDKSPDRTGPDLTDKKTRQANQSAFDMSLVKNDHLEKSPERHLKGNWLAYWEHELGLNEKSAPFNFKQIKLQTFTGHTASVRAISVIDSENAFMSASKDKTVKLWSIQNSGDGQTRQGCRWTYEQHKKSVFAVSFLESARVVLSCDSSVHIWDPFVGMGIRQMEAGGRTPAVCAVAPLPAPSTQAITATTEGTLRFLDVRIASYAHEFKCTYGPCGSIKSVTVSPNSSWVAVGYSTGMISLLDLRTGYCPTYWKGPESEIIQIRALDNNRFLTSSLDQTICVWNRNDLRVVNQLRGHTETVVCFSTYKNEVISATEGNKVAVHSSVDTSVPCEFTCTKLRSDTFKGVLTTMALLPMNRQLLLGANNGAVRLLC